MEISKGIKHMLLATLLFTIANALVKVVVHIPAVEIVLFRSVISLAACWYLLKRRGIYPWGTHRKWLIMRGVFGSVALMLFFGTIQRIPLASALVLFYLTPIVTTLVAHWWLGERFYKVQWLFFAVSMGGILLVKGFDPRIDTLSLCMGLGAAVLSAGAYTTIKRMKGLEDPLVIVMFFPLVTIPLSVPLVWASWVTPVGMDWLVLGIIGVLTQLAQVSMTRGYQMETVSRAASVTYLGVVYGLGIGFVFFDESFGLLVMLGMVLVVIGILLNVNIAQVRRRIKAYKSK